MEMETTLDSTLLENWPLLLGEEGIDPDPDQREDGSKQNGPEHDDCFCINPFKNGYRWTMTQKEKKSFPNRGPPGAVAVVDGVGHAGNHPHHVKDDQCGGRDEKGGPLEEVELTKFGVFGSLGGDGEVGVDAADDPELLVTPPVLDAYAAPSELEDSGGDDGQEEGEEPYARGVVYLFTEGGDMHEVGRGKCAVWAAATAELGQCRLKKISTDPSAQRSTWCSRSDRLMGAEPLNAALSGMQFTDFQPLQCILKPVNMSSLEGSKHQYYLLAPLCLLFVSAADYVDGFLDKPGGVDTLRQSPFVHEGRRDEHRRRPEPPLEVLLRHERRLLQLLVALQSLLYVLQVGPSLGVAFLCSPPPSSCSSSGTGLGTPSSLGPPPQQQQRQHQEGQQSQVIFGLFSDFGGS
ncbi:hypothetical protein B296_00007326 [Ensete ventricosum]|uniref:Uncharacterized protein n=1 Tax=Ensete ventricosum TaxID=4639 RepID=A0A427APS2_ENSVE|nr:hypothetical protein B296_00007326 [Ensete ventricosum]